MMPGGNGASVASLHYFCDAAIDARGRRSGVAVVVRDGAGRILQVASRRLDPMTNNEAEYEALILALELALARQEGHHEVAFLVDSQIVVGQVAGEFAVRDGRLAGRWVRARRLLAQMPRATLVFVPRECNRLADALAQEALQEGLDG
jgi:ribonuclease HI